MQRIVSFVQIYVINFSYNTQNMKENENKWYKTDMISLSDYPHIVT